MISTLITWPVTPRASPGALLRQPSLLRPRHPYPNLHHLLLPLHRRRVPPRRRRRRAGSRRRRATRAPPRRHRAPTCSPATTPAVITRLTAATTSSATTGARIPATGRMAAGSARVRCKCCACFPLTSGELLLRLCVFLIHFGSAHRRLGGLLGGNPARAAAHRRATGAMRLPWLPLCVRRLQQPQPSFSCGRTRA